MSCPHCGRKLHSKAPPCVHCPDVHIPATLAPREEAGQEEVRTVTPEVLGPENSIGAEDIFSQSRGGQAQGGQGQNLGGMHFTTWSSVHGGMFTGSTSTNTSSCLPGLITLALIIALGTRWGVLAALGFAVFYGLGSALGLLITVQRAIRGHTTWPWLRRIVVWSAAALITVTLAGGW